MASNVDLNNISEDIFDTLLNDSPPESSVTDKNIIGGSKPKDEVINKDKKDEQEEDNDDVEETIIVKSKGVKTVNEIEDDLNSLVDETDDNEEIEEDDTIVETSDTDENTVGDFLKAQANALIEKGIWQDVEGLEDIEWSEETYGELLKKQAEWAAEDKYNERLEQSGVYGKLIFEHIENGGDPDDLISLFKEAKEIDEFDTSTEKGKLEKLHKYYVGELGWPESKFKRDSEYWVDKELLDEELEVVDEKLKEGVLQRVEQKRIEAAEYQENQKKAQQKFASTMNGAITARNDISPKEKKEIIKDILEYNQKLPDGRIVNKFTIDFMKLQSDPNKYVDLILFIRDPEKYSQKIGKKIENKVTKKNWDLIKGGAALNKKTGSRPIEDRDTKEYKGVKIDYRQLMND